MGEIRTTWFKELSKEDAVNANQCLVTISDIGAIAGGPTLEELDELHKAFKRFKEITGLGANIVLDSFVEYGYCYGNDYIPESYFGE